jgi:hypothetical protein
MSDERELTPEQEAHVARLLADARHDEPMPAEVAARLDRVLTGIASEHVPGPHEQYTPVIDLAARRRRRATTLLVAAAAVIVAGVGIGQVVGRDSGDDDNGDRPTASDRRAAQPDAQASSAPEKNNDEMSPEELEALGAPARITARSFATDVRRFQDRPGYLNSDSAIVSDEDLAAPRMDFTCTPTKFPAGKLIAVVYNGSPAVLVYRPAAGDTQVVDLVQCSSSQTLRSTTIPLP